MTGTGTASQCGLVRCDTAPAASLPDWGCCCVKRCDGGLGSHQGAHDRLVPGERLVEFSAAPQGQGRKYPVWVPRAVVTELASHTQQCALVPSDDTGRRSHVEAFLGSGLGGRSCRLFFFEPQPLSPPAKLDSRIHTTPPPPGVVLRPFNPPGNQGGGRAGVPSLALAVTRMTSPCRMGESGLVSPLPSLPCHVLLHNGYQDSGRRGSLTGGWLVALRGGGGFIHGQRESAHLLGYSALEV